jgi:nonribosomal peptide synthetase DhbF
MIPLSFAQLRLWFLAQLEGPNAIYNAPFAWRLRGSLDVDAVGEALGDVVARHESLRTVFPSRDGVPYQQVLEDVRPDVVVAQLAEPALPAAMDAAIASVFDLSADVPLRAWLFSVGADEWVLLVVVHHIAADGLSLGPLVRDLGVAYRARTAGAEPEFVALPVQYVDYALWQRELLGERSDPSSELSRLLAFWTAALDGVPEQLELPADRPRPAAPSYRGDVVDVVVDRSLHAGLAALAQSHGVTLFMVLQAAFATLLTRLGAGTDVPIGTPVAGRTEEALEDLVGFFVNTVVLRTDTTGDPSFVELLGRVRETDLAALDHQELPFEQVVEAVSPARSTAHHPLFQVMLTLEPAGTGDGLDLPGIEARPEPFGYGVAKFDLTLSLEEHHDGHGTPAGVTGVLSFAADLFDRPTVEALVQRFANVLEQAVATPALRLSRLDVLLPGERDRLLTGGTPVDVATSTLPALFEAQVTRSPDAVAVVCGDRTVSYGELGAWVDRVACWLVAHGAGPERVVGVALPRSVELVVALLAVVKAGAAYLPIEAGLPAERVRAMVDEARPVLVIEPGMVETAADADDAGPVVGPRPESPAYVIYTSGSTGRPKGVVVTHEAIVNRLVWMQDRFGLEADDRVLQKTPFGFDVSVWEFFWPLSQGATLVLAKPDGHRDPAYLTRLIREQRVTTVHFVPSMLRAFLDEPAAARCDSVRRVICSGEALPAEVQEQYFTTLNAPLFNLYGPTEAAVDVTWWECRAGDPVVPIGSPVWNTSVYVLDANLSPVPTGVAGELYLAGVQLARGYVAQPGLTADRFVADPFGPPGTRMYRTGDLVRRAADGALVYLGRGDDQVKLRGRRIELGEIGAVLANHHHVDQATVIARDGRLVAYVIPATTAPDGLVDELRTTAAEWLPDYMLPSDYVLVDAFPLSRNGKLNHRALPAPARPLTGSRRPRNPREEILCGLFAELLRVNHVGIDDNFFELGGHSLLAAALIASAPVMLGRGLSVADVFRAPTVAQLAALTGNDDLTEVVLRIRPEGQRPPLFLVHPGIGLSWCYAGLARRLPDVPLYGLQARGASAPERMPCSLAEMAEDYLAEVRAIQPHGPYRLAGWSFGGNVAHLMATLLQQRGEEVTLLALLDSYPFAGGPEVSAADAPTPADPAVVERELARFGMDMSRSERFAAVLAHNTWLAECCTPGVFQGDLVFFRANDHGAEPRAEAWEEFVSGTIQPHPVDAGHFELLRAEPLAQIAEVLDRLT